MYAYLNGIIAYKHSDYFVIDVSGVGYKIYCSQSLLSRIPNANENAKVFTHMVVREELIALYGFPTQEELALFEMLLTVSGIGPKVASAIASSFEPTKFAMAVLSSDITSVSSVKGVGKKGAERIILELKDKLKGASFSKEANSKPIAGIQNQSNPTKYSECCSALIVLGYTINEANEAIIKVFNEQKEIEEIIKAALKELMR